MVEQELIDGLLVFVKAIHKRKHEPGKETRFNASFRVGEVDVKIDLTADHTMLRGDMHTTHWEDGNSSVFTSKRSFKSAIEIQEFFDYVASINARLKGGIQKE